MAASQLLPWCLVIPSHPLRFNQAIGTGPYASVCKQTSHITYLSRYGYVPCSYRCQRLYTLPMLNTQAATAILHMISDHGVSIHDFVSFILHDPPPSETI